MPYKPIQTKSYISNIRGAFNMFPDFFVQAFKIVVDSWKFTILLLYILWDDWPTFMISGSNEQLQQQLEHTLLKPDCHCWWISKMQSGRKVTLEELYAIKFCFKLGKNATETCGMLQIAFGPFCMNRTSVCCGRWTIGTSGKRGSVKYLLAARHNDDYDIYSHPQTDLFRSIRTHQCG